MFLRNNVSPVLKLLDLKKPRRPTSLSPGPVLNPTAAAQLRAPTHQRPDATALAPTRRLPPLRTPTLHLSVTPGLPTFHSLPLFCPPTPISTTRRPSFSNKYSLTQFQPFLAVLCSFFLSLFRNSFSLPTSALGCPTLHPPQQTQPLPSHLVRSHRCFPFQIPDSSHPPP